MPQVSGYNQGTSKQLSHNANGSRYRAKKNRDLQTMNRILLIEDDKFISEITQLILEKGGHQVFLAANGDEAILFLKNNTELPDLILLDLMMPIKDGYEFRAEQLKHPQWQQIPTVVLTAEIFFSERKKQLQAQALVKKPLSIAQLLEVVNLHAKQPSTL
jgi:CheY-like chemotaxis protein